MKLAALTLPWIVALAWNAAVPAYGGTIANAEEVVDTPQRSANATDDLRKLMADRREASINGDVEKIAGSMADDYVQTDISGYRQDKATWLREYFEPLAALIKAGKFRWDIFEPRNLQFRVFGDCAIVTGELQVRGTGARMGPQHTWVVNSIASFSGTLSFTHVYVWRDGKWLLAALHNAIPIPPPQK